MSLASLFHPAVADWFGRSFAAPTAAQQAQIDIVRAEFGQILERVRQLIEVDLRALETAAEQAGVPWTSGRMPRLPR